jgi:serine O-acetyltransferase
MEYAYDGTAHRDLVASYAADTEPFPAQQASFPERRAPIEEMGVLRELLFPRCWNAGELVEDEQLVRERIEDLGSLFCHGVQPYSPDCLSDVVTPVLDALPTVRERLRTDVEAAYKGDPAAKSYTEVIRAYPGLQAIMTQRVAHRLYEAGGQVYARELTEAAKSHTGIDIHPGASIGEYFFIDHGTGVVVGETVTVGDWVRIYQDVTLGALHFEEDEDDEHALKKGYKRHPDIGDNVVIGAGSKILGPITVGDHVSIGANTWITDDVADHTTVFVSNHPEQKHKRVEPDTR